MQLTIIQKLIYSPTLEFGPFPCNPQLSLLLAIIPKLIYFPTLEFGPFPRKRKHALSLPK
jgi:hypothetical protein